MKAPGRFAAAIALISGLAVGLASQPAAAGISEGITITYQVVGGSDPANVGSGLTLELFDSTSAVVAGCTESGSGAVRQLRCGTGGQGPLLDGTYNVGVDAVPADHYVADVECENFARQFDVLQIDAAAFPDAEIDYADGDAWRCTVVIQPQPVTTVDVVVDGGAASPSDFTVEFFDATDTIAATTTDPAAGTCVLTGPTIGVCGDVQIAPGDYTLGITPVRGYVATDAFCLPAFANNAAARSLQLPGTQGDVVITADDQPCQITMTYIEQTITADVVITSDDDGTATGADFLIEVLDGDTVVASGFDPEPGLGNGQFTAVLPVGEYTVSVTGPDTYTLEVVVTPVDTDVPDVGAQDLVAGQEELAASLTVSNSLTLSQTQSASITATADDLAPLATTTSTVAPTTTTAPPTGVLPETGTGSSTVLLWGFVMLLFGSGIMLITRRA